MQVEDDTNGKVVGKLFTSIDVQNMLLVRCLDRLGYKSFSVEQQPEIKDLLSQRISKILDTQPLPFIMNPLQVEQFLRFQRKHFQHNETRAAFWKESS